MIDRKNNSQWLGFTSYQEALKIQSQVHAEWNFGWLGFETQEPVVTLGHRAKLEENVHSPEQFKVLNTDRGGLATLHSPGQLVVFPVVDFNKTSLRPKLLICQLLKSMKSFCDSLSEEKFEMRDNGVHSEVGKVGFMGLRIKDRKLSHGISLNICNDLGLFDHIRSCGRDGGKHDRLARIQSHLTAEEAFKCFLRADPGLLSDPRSDITL